VPPSPTGLGATQLLAVQRYAASSGLLHAAHSSSVEHVAGHVRTQAPSALQISFFWQKVLSSAVQATHVLVVVLQIWCDGSHAPQEAFVVQEITGTPRSSVGQARNLGTQLPKFVQ
jgi:hypothetical protein